MTLGSKNFDLVDTILGAGGTVGVESSKYSESWSDLKNVLNFIDFPFNTTNDLNHHFKVIKEVQPRIGVAPDIEKNRTLGEVVELGDEMLKYSDTVILIPKNVHPSKIPDRFRVGLTNADFGSNAGWSVQEYSNCNEVHILGGGIPEQVKIFHQLDNVRSLDGFGSGISAKFGDVWVNGRWEYNRNDLGYYERVEQTMSNLIEYLDRYDQKKVLDYMEV